MEMTYDGALVLPANCVVMDESEMMYVEGGFYINKDRCATMSTYIAWLAGTSTAAIAVMSLGTLSAKIAGKGALIANKLTGLSLMAKVIGVTLAVVSAIQLASFANGVATADRKNTGVSMVWRGAFTNKKYY